MRKRIVSQLALFDQSVQHLTSLIRPPVVLRKMDQVLSENPEFVDLVHTDLTGNASEVGAHGMSAEQVLRTAILRQMKQYSWRELADNNRLRRLPLPAFHGCRFLEHIVRVHRFAEEAVN